jgi:hypothetical protein
VQVEGKGIELAVKGEEGIEGEEGGEKGEEKRKEEQGDNKKE